MIMQHTTGYTMLICHWLCKQGRCNAEPRRKALARSAASCIRASAIMQEQKQSQEDAVNFGSKHSNNRKRLAATNTGKVPENTEPGYLTSANIRFAGSTPTRHYWEIITSSHEKNYKFLPQPLNHSQLRPLDSFPSLCHLFWRYFISTH